MIRVNALRISLPLLVVVFAAIGTGATPSPAHERIVIDGVFDVGETDLGEWGEGAGPLAANEYSPWEPDNDLLWLCAAWDTAMLYLGVVGYASTNNIMILYLDSSSRVTGADPTDWYPGLRAVEAGWDPDILYTCIEMSLGIGASVRRIHSDGSTTEIPGALHAADVPVWEIGIPWSDVGTEANGVLRVAVGLGWATDKLDPTEPLGGMSGDEIPLGPDGDEFVLDRPLRIEYDRDGDGEPDSAGIAFGTMPIRFRAHGPSATTMNLAGTFNNWNQSAEAMSGPDGDGWWTLERPLVLDYYQYKFVADGNRWMSDSLNPSILFPSENSVLLLHSPMAYYHLPKHESTIPTDTTTISVDVAVVEGDTLVVDSIRVYLDSVIVSEGGEHYDPVARRIRVPVDSLSSRTHTTEVMLLGRSGSGVFLRSEFAVEAESTGMVPVRFRVKDPGASTMNLAGSFNGWDEAAEAMSGPDGAGWWTLERAMRQDEHEYKFVADGNRWITDPLNPRVTWDGFNNSILTVENPFAYYLLPVNGSTLGADTATLSADLAAAIGDTLDLSSIEVLLDGSVLSQGETHYDSEGRRVQVPVSDLSNGTHSWVVRLSATSGASFADTAEFTVLSDTLLPVIAGILASYGEGTGPTISIEAKVYDDEGVRSVSLHLLPPSPAAAETVFAVPGMDSLWFVDEHPLPGEEGDTVFFWLEAADAWSRARSDTTFFVIGGDDEPPAITDHFVSPAPLHPDSTAQLSFHLSEAAAVTVRVEKDGAPVVVIAADSSLGAGYHAFLWGAVDSAGAPVSDGEYAVLCEAKDASGNRGSAADTVDVDGDAPPVKLNLILLFHANQNLNYQGDTGNDLSFRGILEAFDNHPDAKAMFHFSGSLLHDVAWFEGTGPGTTIGLLREGVARGQYEIVGSTYAQNVPYGTHDWDNRVQVEVQRAVIESLFSVSPVSWWNAERCWKQSLVSLMAGEGYENTWVERHILQDSGVWGDLYQLRSTRLGSDRVRIFTDDGWSIGAVDGAIDSGVFTNLTDYLAFVHEGNRFGNRVVCYAQDAEATGLWDYEHGADPAPDWANLDAMLTHLESLDWVELTTFSGYLETRAPVEEVYPIVDGQAGWMIGPSQSQGWDDWFDYNENSPMLAVFRDFFSEMREEVIEMEDLAGSDEAALNLVRHGKRNFAAHQFEFACIGCGAAGCQDWQKMETLKCAAEAVRVRVEGPGENPVYMKDINNDGVQEVLLATATDLFVFTPLGGRLIYWWDLENGEQLIGNEMFMYKFYYEGWRETWTGEGWNDDRHYAPRFAWDAPHQYAAAQPFHREYEVRRRALNDRVAFGGAPLAEQMNEDYVFTPDGDSLVFTFSEDDYEVRKIIGSDTAHTLSVAYEVHNLTAADQEVRLLVENGFSPSLLEVMDHGRSSLCYWDGVEEQESVTATTAAVRNRVTGTTVALYASPAPDSLAGETDVFGLELNPAFFGMAPQQGAFAVSLRIEAKSPTSVEDDGSDFFFRVGPNPFPGDAVISFRAPEAGRVTLGVYTPGGRRVRLFQREVSRGSLETITWDGKDEGGRSVASGVYLLRLETPSRAMTRKVVLMRG